MGPAQRAVIRLSGPHLLATAERFLPPCVPALSGAREVLEIQLEPLPGVVVAAHLLVFPGPHSATGEDVCELHLPSAPPLVEAQVQQLLDLGCRLAEPGEFTRRAFLNGRLDLTQAEAVLELVESRSSQAAMAATQVLSGSLGNCMAASRDVLLEALMELEAGLDFEEGDSQDLQPGEVADLLLRAAELLRSGLHTEQQRLLRHGGRFRVGLFGPPNAGKSTLFSQLTGAQSLISAEAGTTRDRREAIWQPTPGALPFTLVDYPGLGGVAVDQRDAAARALAAESDAPLDLVWLCVEPTTPVEKLPLELPGVPCVVLWTKADLGLRPSSHLRAAVLGLAGAHALQLELSGLHGGGEDRQLEDLITASKNALKSAEKALSDHIAHGRRHQEALQDALQCVERAADWDQHGGHQDLVAEELRGALATLALLVGEFTPEEVLDRLFSAFCVGK
jgi:tRNA modification GTPase